VKARWLGLDVVRAAAMLLGVAYHATTAYTPGLGPYYPVADGPSSPALAALGAGLHAFRMQVFFTLAGFFAHLLVERRGVDGFLRDRAKRLVVPFALALPVSIVADVALRTWALKWGVMDHAYRLRDGLRFAPMHLWFLEYLFGFCVVAWAAVKVLGPLKPWTLKWPELLLLLAAPTAWGLVLVPEPRPDETFIPLLSVALHFGAFFFVGFALYAARASLDVLRRCAWMLPVGLALAAWVYTRHVQWEPLGHGLGGVIAWLVTLGALGLAFRFAPLGDRASPTPALQLLVDSSYWVYLVHYPVVVALQVLLTRVEWPTLLKYALVVAGTLLVTLGSFVAFVRRSAVAPWLGVRALPRQR
jgi:peptidoglycan/LPS O-acetylase OafA/YrhL